jgi:hypothetical protein
MTTRVVHSVRCRNPNNKQIWVDVEVLDAVVVYDAGTQTEKLLLTSNIVTPCIIDKTGAGNGKGGDGSQPGYTRLSHMVHVTSPTDSTQSFYVEVLDALNLQPPYNDDPSGPPASEPENYENAGGQADSGQYGGPDICLIQPSSQQTTLVVDNIGLGLQSTQPLTEATRAAHAVCVTSDGNTDDKTTDPTDTIPPQKHPWVGTIRTDGVNFQLPGGNNICVLVPDQDADRDDQTRYTMDPDTGEMNVPPDNTDPNIYIGYPETGSNGVNVHIPKEMPGGISQGILWWIKRIRSPPNPWYWYCLEQDYLAFSFFGSPPESASPKWGYRGFQLFNFFPVIWILSENNPLHPMGSFGSPSLVVCAEEGDWLTSGSIPSANFGVPGGGTFGPFGVLPFVDPPLANSLFDQGVPNIWQMCGVSQPPLANPTKPWNRKNNPYEWPSINLGKQVAQLWEDNWNSVANGVNDAIAGLTDVPWYIGNPPPGWEWSFKWQWPHGPAGYPYATWNAFQNGITAGEIGADGAMNLPPETFVPANVMLMAVDQLDQQDWNTYPSLVWPNPHPPIPIGQSDPTANLFHQG